MTIHTDLNDYGHLIQSKGDFIAGPVAELVVEGDEAVFEKPVEILIPHCIKPNKSRTVRVLYGTDRDFKVIVILLIVNISTISF